MGAGLAAVVALVMATALQAPSPSAPAGDPASSLEAAGAFLKQGRDLSPARADEL